MNWSLAASLTVTALIAALGYLAKYIADVRIDQRKGQLARVDRQLSELYGPMFGLAQTGSGAYAAFLQSVRPDGTTFYNRQPTDAEVAEYRLWIEHVLMPLNRQLAELIFTKTDLLEEDEMPMELLFATVNIVASEALLQHWQDNDYSEWQVVSPFPGDELNEYAAGSYVKLKKRQRNLLERLRLD